MHYCVQKAVSPLHDTMKSRQSDVWSLPQCVHRTNPTVNHLRGPLWHLGHNRGWCQASCCRKWFLGTLFWACLFRCDSFQPVTENMRTSRNEPMNKEFEKLSMASLTPLSCLSMEVLEMLPQFATRGSPFCSSPNGISPTAVLSPGSDVGCPLPFYALQFSA